MCPRGSKIDFIAKCLDPFFAHCNTKNTNIFAKSPQQSGYFSNCSVFNQPSCNRGNIEGKWVTLKIEI